MQIVKNSPKETLSKRKREQKLQGLLYKKRILENQLKTARVGADTSCAYLKAIDDKLKQLPEKSFDWLKLNYERIQVQHAASDYIADFKEFQKNYEGGLIMEIQQTTDREQFNQIEFHYIKEQADKLAEYELFGKVDVKPANVELAEVNKEIQNYIDILTNLCMEAQVILENDKSLTAFDKAKMEKDLFEWYLHLQTQQKRLNKRLDYYNNQFLPIYNADMEECSKNLDRYLEILNKLVELRIDPQLGFMLDEYEKHKEDEEQLWLFYTALRIRLQSIGKHIGRNKKKFSHVTDLMAEFL